MCLRVHGAGVHASAFAHLRVCIRSPIRAQSRVFACACTRVHVFVFAHVCTHACNGAWVGVHVHSQVKTLPCPPPPLPPPSTDSPM